MSQSNLKKIAEELEKSLAAAPQPKKTAPAPKTEQKAETPKKDLTPIVRAVVEYALSRAGEGRTAAQIGEAIGHGITAAAKELKLSESELVGAYESYLGELMMGAFKVRPSGG